MQEEEQEDLSTQWVTNQQTNFSRMLLVQEITILTTTEQSHEQELQLLELAKEMDFKTQIRRLVPDSTTPLIEKMDPLIILGLEQELISQWMALVLELTILELILSKSRRQESKWVRPHEDLI